LLHGTFPSPPLPASLARPLFIPPSAYALNISSSFSTPPPYYLS
jgi:hypothetical protein